MTAPMSISYAQGPNPALFPLLLGRSGGQTLYGGTGASENLILSSTLNATKGKIVFGSAAGSAYDEVNNRLGVGNAAPGFPLDVTGVANFSTGIRIASAAALGNHVVGNGTNYVGQTIHNYQSAGDANYTIVSADYAGYAHFILRCDPVAADRVVTLPSTASADKSMITIWVNQAGGHKVTVTCAGTDVILDSAGGSGATRILDSNWESITLVAQSATLWLVIGRNWA